MHTGAPKHRDDKVEQHDRNNEQVNHEENLGDVPVDAVLVKLLEHPDLAQHGFEDFKPALRNDSEAFRKNLRHTV